MSTFNVRASEVRIAYYKIEADSIEEAETKFYEGEYEEIDAFVKDSYLEDLQPA